MFPSVQNYCDQLTGKFDEIPGERKQLLEKISEYIIAKRIDKKPVRLVYICTHNSRRSHFAQVWAKVAATFYNIQDVHTYSGGTEATAFNINAINALKRTGFEILPDSKENNPVYSVSVSEKEKPLECFSKKYDDKGNPKFGFAAIMTCSEAEENCPFIPGAELRISTAYEDPKAFDNTPLQEEKYSERCRQIALETFYVFSKVILEEIN